MEYKLPAEFRGIKIFSSEVSDGSMDSENIDEHLPRFLSKLSLISPVAYCQQVHGIDIKIIKEKGLQKSCDGLATGERIDLIVKSADCIPLFWYSKKEGMIGSLHVSRASLVSGIITKSLKSIFEKFALSPSEVIFFIGPHVRTDNYEVQGDVLSQIRKSGYSPFLAEKNQKTFFNLTESLQSDLVKIGCLEENIFDSEIDTFSDERFFSYRRGDRNKLFITIITWPNDK